MIKFSFFTKITKNKFGAFSIVNIAQKCVSAL